MKKVFVHLATGFEDVEAISIIDVLRRAEIEVTTVSISEERTVLSAHNVPVIADKLFSEVDYNEAQMIVLPGGLPGANHLDEHTGLKEQIKNFNQQGKGLAAICAAPMVFGHLDLLHNKPATCYPGFEKELSGAQITEGSVVEADNIITSKGPGTALLFALKIVEKLKGAELAQQLKAGMLING